MTFKTETGTQKLLKVEEYKACEYWLDSFRSPATKRGYVLALQLFCRFFKTTPDDIVKKSHEQVEMMLMKYIVYLKRNAVTFQTKPQVGRISVNAIANYVFGVKHFFRMLYGKKWRQVDWDKINDMLPERVRNTYRAYTREEIQMLLAHADSRMRVIILLMTSGGMRVGALPDLKFKDIKELANSGGIGTVSIYANSVKDHYFSLLTLECMNAIKTYREDRTFLQETITEESYVLRDHFANHSRRTNKPQPLQRNTVVRQVRRLIQEVLKDTDNLQTDHGFRKYFNSCLMNSDVSYQFKELLMGHSIALDETYYDENNEQSKKKILAEYVKAINELTISDEHRLKKEVDRLEQDLKASAPKELIVQYAVESEGLKKRIAELEARVFDESWEKALFTDMAKRILADPELKALATIRQTGG